MLRDLSVLHRIVVRNARHQSVVRHKTAELQLLLFDLLDGHKLLQLDLCAVEVGRQLALEFSNRRAHLARLELVVGDVLDLEDVEDLDAAAVELDLGVDDLERKQVREDERAGLLHGALLELGQLVVDLVAVVLVGESDHAAEVGRARAELGGDGGGRGPRVDDENDDAAVDAETVIKVDDDVLAQRVGEFGAGADSKAVLLLELDDENEGIAGDDALLRVLLQVVVVQRLVDFAGVKAGHVCEGGGRRDVVRREVGSGTRSRCFERGRRSRCRSGNGRGGRR